MSHDVIDLAAERSAPPAETLAFSHATRLVQATRIGAAAAAGLFVVALAAALPVVLTIVLFAAALVAASAALDVHRRAALRPDRIDVAPQGLTLRGGTGSQTIAWTDVVILTHDRARARIHVVDHEGGVAFIDADIEQDTGALLGAAAMHIDASRRTEIAPALDRAPRPAVFPRAPWLEGSALAVAALGLLLGLTASPALFILTALGLPALLWCWAREPHRVIVDDSTLRIVHRFSTDVVPIRAIRDCTLAVHGRLPGVAVIVDHRERGPIVLHGLGTHALPVFDAVMAALRTQKALRSGAATARNIIRTPRTRSGRFNAAILAGSLLLATWLTLLTGVPLRTAARFGNDAVLDIALLLGSPRSTADGAGLTALHHAALRDDADMVQKLVRSGARIDARTKEDALSPLHIAAGAGNLAATRALIEARADVHARSTSGRTPLAHAVAGSTAPDVDLARALLDAGADPNAADSDGRTPLHHAALNAHIAWIPPLARAGASLEARDTSGSAPLHLAARAHHAKMIDALIRAGADVDARGAAGRTAVAAAAQDRNTPPAVTDALLSAHARVDIPGDDGWNALQLAAAINNAPTLEQFARRRVPVDATEGELPPALHIAIRRHNVDAVRALLRGGASPSRPFNGTSAYDVARATGNPTISALVRMR